MKLYSHNNKGPSTFRSYKMDDFESRLLEARGQLYNGTLFEMNYLVVELFLEQLSAVFVQMLIAQLLA